MSYSFRLLKKRDLATCTQWLYPITKEPKIKQILSSHLKNGVGLALLDNGCLSGCAFWFYEKRYVSLSYFYIMEKLRKRPIVFRFLCLVASYCKGREILFRSKDIWEFKSLAIPQDKKELYKLRIPAQAIKRRGAWVER